VAHKILLTKLETMGQGELWHLHTGWYLHFLEYSRPLGANTVVPWPF
jgi:hypothetical protein